MYSYIEQEEDEIPISLHNFNSDPGTLEEDPLAAVSFSSTSSPPLPLKSSTRRTQPTRNSRPRRTTTPNRNGKRQGQVSEQSVRKSRPAKNSGTFGTGTTGGGGTLPSFKNKLEFILEMDRNIGYIMDESISLFGLDPREYHPFYLRIYKYVAIGQQLGYLSSAEGTSVWEKFDRICKKMMETPKTKATFIGEESAYATFIKTGKVIVNGREVKLRRNAKAIKKRFLELEEIAKNIVDNVKRQRRRKGSEVNIRSNLKLRMEFFENCKSMTFPKDCVKMNQLWHDFLNEFPSSSSTTRKRLKVGSKPEVEKEEESTKVEVIILDKDRDRVEEVQAMEWEPPVTPPSPVPINNVNGIGETNQSPHVAVAKSEDSIENQGKVVNVRVKLVPASSKSQSKVKLKKTGKGLGGFIRTNKVVLPTLKGTQILKKLTSGKRSVIKQTQLEKIICSGRPASLLPKSRKTVLKKLSLKKKITTCITSDSIPEKKNSTYKDSEFPLVVDESSSSSNVKTSSSPDPIQRIEDASLNTEIKSVVTETVQSADDNNSKKSIEVEDKQHICPECEKKCNNKRNLTHHIIWKHKANRDRLLEQISVVVSSRSGVRVSLVESELGNAANENSSAAADDSNKDDGPPTCDECGETFAFKANLVQHKMFRHQYQVIGARLYNREPILTEPLACEKCGRMYNTLKSFKAHKYYTCCDRPNPDPSKYIKRKRKSDRGFCPICKVDKGNLWSHFQSFHVHLETVQSQVKNPVLKARKQVLSNDSADLDTFCCEICGKPFSFYCNLARHLKEYHSTEEKLFLCQQCPKEFKSKDAMDAHVKQVHLGQNYRCDICSRIMQTGGKLWKHKVDQHGMSNLEPPPGLNVMECNVCGEIMLRGLLKHMEMKHPENVEKFKKDESSRRRKLELRKQHRLKNSELYKNGDLPKHEIRRKTKCPHCDVRFSGVGKVRTLAYANHIKEVHGHDPVYAYKCPNPKCDKSYQFPGDLTQHLLLGGSLRLPDALEGIGFIKRFYGEGDDDEMSSTCLICDWTTSSTTQMKIHFVIKHPETFNKVRKYSGECVDHKLFEVSGLTHDCTDCDAKLDTYQLLLQHIEINHSDKVWKCPECERIVVSPENLKEHFMLEHADPDPIAEWAKEFQAQVKNGKLISRRVSKHRNKKRKPKSDRSSLPKRSPLAKNPRLPKKVREKVQKTPKKTETKKAKVANKDTPEKISKASGRRGRPRKQSAKNKRSDLASDADKDYPRGKLRSKTPPSTSTRRRTRRGRSRFKITGDGDVINLKDFQLKDCIVSVRRLGEDEIRKMRNAKVKIETDDG